MVSLFRLKGRALQIDNTLTVSLAFFTGAVILLTANFLPVVYDRYITLFIISVKDTIYGYLNLLASLAFFASAFGIYSSVRLGAKRYFYKKSVRKKAVANDIFFYFRPIKFFSAFFYCCKMVVIKLMLFFFCFMPSVICIFTADRFSRQGVSALVCFSLAVTAVCLLINGGVYFSLFFASFFLCDYYFISGRCLSFRHLITCSQHNMKKNYRLLMWLKLSFTGWFVLCIFIFPLPYVWGYYNQSLAVAAAEFMRRKED